MSTIWENGKPLWFPMAGERGREEWGVSLRVKSSYAGALLFEKPTVKQEQHEKKGVIIEWQ
jgi:hypothetical protein